MNSSYIKPNPFEYWKSVLGQAPVVMINERIYGKVTPEMISGIINHLVKHRG